MEQSTQSEPEKIMCCRIRGWCILTAWLQMILGAVFLAMGIGHLDSYSDPKIISSRAYVGDHINDADRRLVMEISIMAIIFSTMEILMGIILLVGVFKRHPQILTVWIGIRATVSGLALIAAMRGLTTSGFGAGIRWFAYIVTTLNCIFTVKRYRKELLSEELQDRNERSADSSL